MPELLTYVTITQNRKSDIQRDLERVLPFVDKAVVIDGGSTDQTWNYLNSLGPKVKAVQRPWDDSFANQSNEYLKYIRSGWILICDDDELPTEEMMKECRRLVDESGYGTRYSVIEFRCHDIVEGKDMGVSNYWRQMCVRWTPNLNYKCHLHQHLYGHMNEKKYRSNTTYYHIKNNIEIYRSACRNYWIGGLWIDDKIVNHDGVKDSEYHEFKSLVKQYHPEVKVFNDLAKHMINGTVNDNIKSWIKNAYQKHETEQYYNELRAYYTWYFKVLHPNEKE
jgi:glycosyltransferase involved in cell wall biosynthesis